MRFKQTQLNCDAASACGFDPGAADGEKLRRSKSKPLAAQVKRLAETLGLSGGAPLGARRPAGVGTGDGRNRCGRGPAARFKTCSIVTTACSTCTSTMKAASKVAPGRGPKPNWLNKAGAPSLVKVRNEAGVTGATQS